MLALLPKFLQSQSISSLEVVLPENAVIDAINLFEREGFLLLGWEGWIKSIDGRIGHGNAPQGTVSLDALSVSEAAEFCKTTIRDEAMRWRAENPLSTDCLYFCITVQE